MESLQRIATSSIIRIAGQYLKEKKIKKERTKQNGPTPAHSHPELSSAPGLITGVLPAAGKALALAAPFGGRIAPVLGSDWLAEARSALSSTPLDPPCSLCVST